MPAVSTNTIGPSSVSTSVSMASRVVPGRSWTTDRSSPTKRLKSVLLPTFGRPTMATRGGRGSSGVQGASCSGVAGASADASATSVAGGGRSSTTTSSRSPARRPCRALIGYGSPRPSARNSHRSSSRRSLSALLATTSTVREPRRSQSAMASSSSVMPTDASTTNRTTSASRTAASTCRLTFTSRSLPLGFHPPVSMTRNGRPSHSPSSSLRSRVMPGWSSTIAACSPRMRLNSVLLPTLGRPTMATTGR